MRRPARGARSLRHRARNRTGRGAAIGHGPVPGTGLFLACRKPQRFGRRHQHAAHRARPESGRHRTGDRARARLCRPPRLAAAGQRAHQPDPRPGLRRDHQQRRPDPHQRARGREHRRGPGPSRRRPALHGTRGRRRQAHRCRPAEDRRHRPVRRRHRRLLAACAGRLGGGHQRAVRIPRQRHGGRGQRGGPPRGRRRRRPLHPDRRRHQPGQFRQPAVRQPRRGRRHEFDDLQRQRRLHGPVVRGAHQPGDADRDAAARARQRPARPPGRGFRR